MVGEHGKKGAYFFLDFNSTNIENVSYFRCELRIAKDII